MLANLLSNSVVPHDSSYNNKHANTVVLNKDDFKLFKLLTYY